MTGMSKSSISKLCTEIYERVHAFLKRPLADDWPYLWLDATYLKVREGGRIVSVAAIIAAAVNIDGKREIVGLHIGPSEARAVLTELPLGPGPRRSSALSVMSCSSRTARGSSSTATCRSRAWQPLPHQ